MRHTVLAATIIAISGTAALATFVPTGVITNRAALSNSQINLGSFTGTVQSLDRPYKSSDGTKWVTRLNLVDAAGTPIITGNDDLIVSGNISAAGVTASVRVREGVTALEGTRVSNNNFQQRISINNSGEIAFVADLDGATTDDNALIRSSGSSFIVAAREGGPTGGIAGQNNGPTLSAPNLDNNNRVAWRTFGMPAPATTGNTVALLRETSSGVLLDARTGTPAAQPTGFQAGTASTWQNISSGGGLNQGNYHVSGDGLNWFTGGDTTFATTTQDGILVYNNAIVLQEGFAVPGSSNPAVVDDFFEIGMDPNGTWWARASLLTGTSATTDTDVLIAQGAVIASTGDVILASSTERWSTSGGFSETFFLYAVNNVGGSIIGGVTDNSDTLRNAVLVYRDASTSFELLREGDAVDLDGNGLLDDNAFINTFGNDDLILTDSGRVLFQATIKDGAGASLGEAYLSLVVPSPSALALLGVAGLTAARRRR